MKVTLWVNDEKIVIHNVSHLMAPQPDDKEVEE